MVEIAINYFEDLADVFSGMLGVLLNVLGQKLVNEFPQFVISLCALVERTSEEYEQVLIFNKKCIVHVAHDILVIFIQKNSHLMTYGLDLTFGSTVQFGQKTVNFVLFHSDLILLLISKIY
jgi:hypothetical protein